MARSLWSGAISFGLVNIPVKLFSATESHRVAFHELEEGSGERIHYKRVAGNSNREVPWKKIEKGFEVRKGRFVVLTDEELAAAAPEKTRTIDVEQFVSLDEIDPIAWDRTYYVAPDGAAAAKAYQLMRKAMADRKRVAIGRFVMRTKEYVVCIRPYEDILALETMFFPDEIRKTKDVGTVPKTTVGRGELQMAERLIDMLTTPWNPTKHTDTFSARVMDLVRKKDRGKEIVIPEETAEEPRVVDLMEALKQTLAGQGKGRRPASSAGHSSGSGDRARTTRSPGSQARHPARKNSAPTRSRPTRTSRRAARRAHK